MKSLSAQKIRTEFLEYFHGHRHQKVRSSSLIPSNDPTVLLTTAGMQQFKPYFLGEQEPPARRLTTAQKCFRTSDIEEVGDSTHDTFFEMLGNFSVGDYFMKEAIAFAWELLVDEWEIPPERLSITVFGGYESLPPDEEAERLWNAQSVPAERIFRFGPKDNFWGPPGVTGPCGPCSEIHYDLTQVPCSDPSCGPNCECGRFLEIWNLVFMEYNKEQQGNFDPLPSKNIDTGMGLERIALVLQRKENIFATDLFAPILEAVEQLCNFSLKDAEEAVVRSSRVIADHIRAATFLVSDGVLPSNDGRGYVLRRILRKALVHGRRLGRTEPFVERLLNVVIDNFQAAYPELSCSEAPVELSDRIGIHKTSICPSKENVYEFLDDLFEETSELFPSKYVHIGSDEVVATDWLDDPGSSCGCTNRLLQGTFMQMMSAQYNCRCTWVFRQAG